MKPTQRVPALVVGLLAVLVVTLGFSSTAAASSVQISLTPGGPNPSSATAVSGDDLVFTNNDLVSHQLKAKSSNWALNHTVGAGETYSVKLPAPNAKATYTYTDAHVVGFGTQTNDGTVAAAAPAPSPTASHSPSASASAKPSSSPVRSASPASPGSSGSPGATPTSSTGTAIGPGLGVGVLPTAAPSESGGPQPNVAPLASGAPSPSPSPGSTAALATGPNLNGNGVVTGSGHRYGLPTALAVVAIAGVASLLVRLLLAHPAAVHKADPS